MNLVIDIGNTRVKLAVFKDDAILEQSFCHLDELNTNVKDLYAKYIFHKSILSSVVNLDSKIIKELNNFSDVLVLSPKTKLPFVNNYESPETLGLDRIALVAAASKIYTNKNCLIIDAGTCITYDFIDNDNIYHGGAISPGLFMRYNALAHFTAKLPKLSPKEVESFIGNTTSNSIHSGVIFGIKNEIEGIVKQYQSHYEDLTVVLTGGDVNFLSKQLKNSIFATQNFLLQGLNTILNYNYS